MGGIACRPYRVNDMHGFSKTKTEELQELVEWYRDRHNVSSVNLKEVAAWAIREKVYEPEPRSTMKLLAKELSAALREVYFTDPQGRRVRKKHAQRIWDDTTDGRHEQKVLWHDITEATRPQMQAAFQQRRHGIVMDCRQLRHDVESYNENFNKSVPIQMVFDFTEDLKDLEHAGN